MKSIHELRNENHSSLGLKNLTELVNKHIKGKVGKEQVKEIKKVLSVNN